jgi:hypothetical protein
VIENLAIWYLKRRGRFVLPRIFLGLVFGNAIATETEPGTWTVLLDPRAPNQLITMTNSIITRRHNT